MSAVATTVPLVLPTFSTMPLDGESLPARMVMSAIAGCGAACFCHPFDVLRVQMQTAAQSGGATLGIAGTAGAVIKRDGMRGLYNGLSAAFLRQWMYGSGRMGIYSFLLNRKKREGGAPNFGEKIVYGMFSGGIGAFVGTPSEVGLVRMSADSQMPADQRRNYKNIVDCLSRITQQEGVAGGLYKGSSITVARAMALASTQLATYSSSKEYLLEHHRDIFVSESSIATMAVASVPASLVANAASMPFDVVKSIYQNMPKPAEGRPPLYSGVPDCARQLLAQEGPLALWKGFTPAFVKLMPYTILSFLFLEKLTIMATGKAAL